MNRWGNRRTPRTTRRRPLVTGLAFALAALPMAATATTRIVTTCADSGPGSLRDAFAMALSGDTIDLASLACTTITLTSGALATDLDDLTVRGRAAASIAIDAGNASRIFEHHGAGTLVLDRITVRHGRAGDRGGCIYGGGNVSIIDGVVEECRAAGTPTAQGAAVDAVGDVELTRSNVLNASATATSSAPFVARVSGGAINALGAVTMLDSTISGVAVSASSSDGGSAAYGGGVDAGGLSMTRSRISIVTMTLSGGYVSAGGGGARSNRGVMLVDSTISGNTIQAAEVRDLGLLFGGGLDAGYRDSVTLLRSTISDNEVHCTGDCAYAYLSGGGIAVSAALYVVDSTISGNRADGAGGGIYAFQLGHTALANATITNNSALTGTGIYDLSTPHDALVANSSIVAIDMATRIGGVEIVTQHPIIGANNLITSANVPLPSDTLSNDPMLGPLADNGGHTQTHALLAGSPALDAGNDVAGLDSDQRGGSYVRVFGPAPDIGAFEVQPDTIFQDGFD